jgi:hypothetical protein
MAVPRLRIAWFSDLSVGRVESLSTYCTRLLVPELGKLHDIEVFSDEAALEGASTLLEAPVFHYLNAYKRHRAQPFDLFFYQLEDSRACRFIRGHIGLMPGVVWVHDLFCNDLGPEACHTSPWERTIQQFFDPSLEFVDRSKAPHQLWPRAFRETSLCPVVLFSSAWARNEFRRMVSNRLESGDGIHHSSVLSIPVERCRAIAERREGPFQLATVSVPGVEGRSHKVLPVLRDLAGEWRLTWLVDANEARAAQELISEFGIPDERVTLITERSVAKWTEIVERSHVALHLHTSPFGHLAPFIQLSLAQGCPVITARSAQGEDVPGDVVFRITPGLHESAELRAILSELITAGSPASRGQYYGAPGLLYARQHFDLQRAVDCLSNTLVEFAPHVSHVMDRWASIGRRAGRVLLSEVHQLVSAGPNDVVSAYEHVLSPALRDLQWDR